MPPKRRRSLSPPSYNTPPPSSCSHKHSAHSAHMSQNTPSDCNADTATVIPRGDAIRIATLILYPNPVRPEEDMTARQSVTAMHAHDTNAVDGNTLEFNYTMYRHKGSGFTLLGSTNRGVDLDKLVMGLDKGGKRLVISYRDFAMKEYLGTIDFPAKFDLYGVDWCFEGDYLKVVVPEIGSRRT